MRAFRRAVNCDDQLPEAYLGLGLLFRKWPKGDYDAVRNFQKALQYRRDYVEARFNIAEIRYRHCELDAKGDIEKVLAADPKYAPAYKLMGMFYEDLRKEYDAAALYYAQYLSLRPGDKEARVRLGRAYLRASNYDRILDLLEAHGIYEWSPDVGSTYVELLTRLEVVGAEYTTDQRLIGTVAQVHRTGFLRERPDGSTTSAHNARVTVYRAKEEEGSGTKGG